MQRIFDQAGVQKVVDVLGDKKDQSIIIYYAPDDEESFNYGNGLRRGLELRDIKMLEWKGNSMKQSGRITYPRTKDAFVIIIGRQ